MIHFEFSNWLSLVLIALIIVFFVGFVAYVALSIHSLRKCVKGMVTKLELAEEFQKFKLEISGNET